MGGAGGAGGMGGTGNNIRLAKLRGIKILNFWNEVDREEAYNLLI
jgi:hypothetical protein